MLDELAFVLGHEMAHVVRGHAMDRMVSGAVLNAASRASLAARMMNKGMFDAALATGCRRPIRGTRNSRPTGSRVRLLLSAGMDPLAGARDTPQS